MKSRCFLGHHKFIKIYKALSWLVQNYSHPVSEAEISQILWKTGAGRCTRLDFPSWRPSPKESGPTSDMMEAKTSKIDP